MLWCFFVCKKKTSSCFQLKVIKSSVFSSLSVLRQSANSYTPSWKFPAFLLCDAGTHNFPVCMPCWCASVYAPFVPVWAETLTVPYCSPAESYSYCSLLSIQSRLSENDSRDFVLSEITLHKVYHITLHLSIAILQIFRSFPNFFNHFLYIVCRPPVHDFFMSFFQSYSCIAINSQPLVLLSYTSYSNLTPLHVQP